MKSAAFISDIHSNLEALKAVLADIDRLGYEEILCLGDVVGYGPDPRPCVDLVRKRCRLSLLGNHDEALFKGAWGFNKLARGAVDWTRKQLRPQWLRAGSRQRWRFLRDLPLQFEWSDFLLVHGSPREPTTEYILPHSVDWPDPSSYDELFTYFERGCLVGHTHIPGIFKPERRFVPQAELADAFHVDEGKFIMNVGSVGQPRDQDWRACYLSVEGDGLFRFHRVEYAVEVTQRKIRATTALDNRLADRLSGGL